jgi:hypothetical protein
MSIHPARLYAHPNFAKRGIEFRQNVPNGMTAGPVKIAVAVIQV